MTWGEQEESANKGIYLQAVILTFDVALGAPICIILYQAIFVK